MNLQQEIKNLITPELCASAEVYEDFLTRLETGGLTKQEDPLSHFSTHFLPYNTETQEVFFVDHKKAQTWIAPGGHIEAGEGLLETLNREISEELGVKDFFKSNREPFFFTTKNINYNQTCKKHYDIWYLMPTDGKDFQIDMSEFNGAKWMKISDAKKLVTDENNLMAIDRIAKN